MSGDTKGIEESAVEPKPKLSLEYAELSAIQEQTDKLHRDLDKLYLIIENLSLRNVNHFFPAIIAIRTAIKAKEGIDILSYYGLLKTFLPCGLTNPNRIPTLQDALLLKIDTLDSFLSSLMNQAKLELYSLNPYEKSNPIIRQTTASFVEMHLMLFKNLLNKQTNNEQQIKFVAKKIAILKSKVAELEKLNILEFIARVEWHLSYNLYPQLLSPINTFCGRGKANKKLIQAINCVFEDLHSKPFTAQALIGALHLIEEHFASLLNKLQRDSLTKAITQFLQQLQDVEKYEQSTCIQLFEEQAKNLALIWPKTKRPTFAKPFFTKHKLLNESENFLEVSISA